MSGPKNRLPLSPAQAVYLRELVEDDLEETAELTAGEKQQAKSIIRKLDEILLDFGERGVLPSQKRHKDASISKE